MRNAIVVAVLVGIAVAIQVSVVGRSSRTVHPLAISLALQGSGLVAGAVWATTQNAWAQVGSIGLSWWWLPIGAVGWIIVGALGFASGRIGVSATLAVVVTAQLTMGLLIDVASGEASLTLRQPLGAVVLVAGVLMVTIPAR